MIESDCCLLNERGVAKMFETEPKGIYFWVERAISSCRSIFCWVLKVYVGFGVLAVDEFRGVAARHSQENNAC